MFLLLFPDIALILFGFALSRKTKWGPGFWSGLEQMIYFALFPALLFHSIVRNPIRWSETGALMWAVGALIVVSATAALAARVLKPNRLRLASSLQCAFRFNSYIVLAVSQSVGGAKVAGLAAICIGIAVPICNTLAVWALARHARSNILKELLRNPLILATVAALAWSTLGLTLPKPVGELLSRMGSASLALGLITVGAGLKFSGAQGDRPLLAWITAVKLLLTPLCAVLAARLLALDHDSALALLVFAAAPTASSCYILANRMGGDGAYVALHVSVSTIVAMLTLPLWLIAFAQA